MPVTSTQLALAAFQSAAAIAYQSIDPIFGGSVTLGRAFARTGTLVPATGATTSLVAQGTAELSVSFDQLYGTRYFGVPQSSPTSNDYLVYACGGSSTCAVTRMSSTSFVDSTDNGIATSSLELGQRKISHNTEDCCSVSSATTAVWNISYGTTKRLAWLSGFSTPTLSIATRGTNFWTTAVATSTPPRVTLLRSDPNGNLVNVARTSTGLEVRFEVSGWAPMNIPLPAGAQWKAKFDDEGVFRVVTSHASTGTMLHTRQGNRFTSEQVSPLSFSKVDFAVLDDGQAVVAGTESFTLTLFR
ncbi:MAG: hypothetical protein Q8L14_33165 [Myxococcales bacterium]|nr:hypothetical protein [Myxococcales bacterium]